MFIDHGVTLFCVQVVETGSVAISGGYVDLVEASSQ